MLPKTALRWLAGLGAIGAIVAAATPAAAQAPAAELSIFFSDQTIAADSAGKLDSVIMFSSAPTVLHGAVATFDATDLAGQVELAEEDGFNDCTAPAENVLKCTEEFDIDVDENGLGGLFDVVVKPAATATAGAAGTLKITLTSAGFAPATTAAKVRVGEGVDLASGPDVTASGKPGGGFTAPLTVRNAGKTAAEGASVIFFNDFAIEPAKRHSNCTYDGARLRSCTFDTPLAPGTTHTAPLAYTLRPDTQAPDGAFGETAWMTPAELEDYVSFLEQFGRSLGTPGNGPALTLMAARAAAADPPQADTEPTNNWGILEVTVTGKNGADLAAVGDTLTGGVDAKVTADVGLVNKGPAAIDFSRSGEHISVFDVTIPPGTTVVGVPEGCEANGARAYLCHTGSFLGVGQAHAAAFALRVDKVIPNATGTVKIKTECECTIFRDDLDPANNTAKILVNPTSTGGGGGGGGGLPVTGTASRLIGAAGALLLVAGGVGLWLARRRRIRFVA